LPVQWTDELATGIARIDEQHRELYRQVAALHAAMRTGHVEQVSGTLEFLQGYMLDHFATEEREMERTAYPGLKEHRRLHQRFVEDFLRQKAALLAAVTPSAVVELSHWLTDWLSDHVRRVDGDMARHLRHQARVGG
jgi:hemerythrin